MDLRSTALELARRHALDRASSQQLLDLASPPDAPADATRRIWQGVAALAAALGGLGLVMWVAANWDEFGRMGRFALLQACVVVPLLAAVCAPRVRAPMGLLALLAIGALFAYFGQTYQTGADPWQLFALWAVLALPLCLALRSELTWVPWTLVVATGIGLWMQAHGGHGWRVDGRNLAAHLAGWAAMLALLAWLDARWRPRLGTGVWSWRLAATLFVVLVTTTGITGLFAYRVAPQYGVALLVVLAWSAWMCTPRGFEIYGLSAAALGFHALVLCGLARWALSAGKSDPVAALLLIGLAAAVLLALTVRGILHLARQYAGEAAP